MSSTFPEIIRSSLYRLLAVPKRSWIFVTASSGINTSGPRFSLLLFLAFLSVTTFSKTEAYLTDGQCNGYPRAAIDTQAGLCLGLVHQGTPLVKPRKVLEWQPGILLITDMGGWGDHRGTLWRYDVKANAFEALFSKLNLPHGLTRAGAEVL